MQATKMFVCQKSHSGLQDFFDTHATRRTPKTKPNESQSQSYTKTIINYEKKFRRF